LYGVTVGPDGNVYIANGDVYRVWVDTGVVELLVDLRRIVTAHTLDFNLDSTKMYIGTIGGGFYAVDLDDDLNPLGEEVEVATFGGWHDGTAVDECGDIWVADYSTSSLYRVDGETYEVTMVHRASPTSEYGHGIMWGTGIGGWRLDALYQPLPYNRNKVKEVIIDARSGDHVRTWRGKPVP
jgi:streptogramin lyase